MNSSTKIILGIIGAAAVGAAVGMLLAPEKGSEIRGRVKRRAGDIADSIVDLFSETKDELHQMKRKARESANNVTRHAKKSYDDMKESLS